MKASFFRSQSNRVVSKKSLITAFFLICDRLKNFYGAFFINDSRYQVVSLELLIEMSRFLISRFFNTYQWCRNRGGQGGHWPPPIFGRSVNPIPTGEGRLSPPITSGTPNVFHLPAPLSYI